jgi:hypothetical protein
MIIVKDKISTQMERAQANRERAFARKIESLVDNVAD